MLIRTAEGSYQPSHFFIEIDSDDDFEKLLKDNQQTFEHEYIHFLQDLILPYCIRTNLTTIRMLACINGYTNQYKELTRPFNGWDKDYEVTSEQFDYTWGCGIFVNGEYRGAINRVKEIKRISVDIKTITVTTGKEIDLYKYMLETEYGWYHVGARDFLEYIAHKVESSFWNTDDAPDFPYRVVDRMFEYYGFSDIPIEVRICVAEYCLYNDNPVRMFFNYFVEQQIISENKEKFLSYDTCKEFLLTLPWAAKGGGPIETIFSKTKRRLDDFKKWLGYQYQHRQFSDIKKWVEYVSDYAEKNFSNRFIFSELYQLDYDEFRNRLDKYVEDIGVPMLFNKKHQWISKLPDGYDREQFLMFFIFLGFLNYISSTGTSCPIADYCKADSSSSLFDKSTCLTDPISSVKRRDLCPFALFLKSYGFDSITFK